MEPGMKVRFIADNLGAFDKYRPFPHGKFDGVVHKGETGVIADWEAGPAMNDWLGVIPDEHPDYLVPVHEGMIEVIEQ